jgi:hypothetical protein
MSRRASILDPKRTEVHVARIALLQGLMVGFVIAAGRTCPAMVVRDNEPHPDGHSVNLQVFLDGGNDVSRAANPHGATPEEGAKGMAYRPSVSYDKDKAVGTWHFPEGSYVPEEWVEPKAAPKAPPAPNVAPETEPQVPTLEQVKLAGYAPEAAQAIVDEQTKLHAAWSAAQAAKVKQA